MDDFACAMCGATFATQERRGEHYVSVHPNRSSVSAGRPSEPATPTSPKAGTAVAVAAVGFEAVWRTIKFAAVVFAIVVLIGGWLYGRSDGFRLECVAHKSAGYDMGTLKNLICDANFQIKQ